MGYEGIQANLMSVPPFLVGAVALVTWVWISDHFKERSLVAAAAMFISIIGYIPLIASRDNHVRYGFLFVIMIGAGSINPLSAAWLNDNTPEQATRSIIMGIYGWNNVAGVIAGQVYSSKYSPTYRTSVCVTLGIVALGTVGFIASRALYMHENKKRRKGIEKWREEQVQEEKLSPQRQGDAKRVFIFGY
jgi:MFS family permease